MDKKDLLALNMAIVMLKKAIDDPGSHPYYHYKQLERLKTEWPTLWIAIQDVLKYG